MYKGRTNKEDFVHLAPTLACWWGCVTASTSAVVCFLPEATNSVGIVVCGDCCAAGVSRFSSVPPLFLDLSASGG